MLIQKYICRQDMIELLDSIIKKNMRAILEYYQVYSKKYQTRDITREN